MATVTDFTEYRNRKLKGRMHEVQRNQERFARRVAIRNSVWHHICEHEPLPVAIPRGQCCKACGHAEGQDLRDAVAAIWGPDFPGGAA